MKFTHIELLFLPQIKFFPLCYQYSNASNINADKLRIAKENPEPRYRSFTPCISYITNMSIFAKIMRAIWREQDDMK